MAIAIRVPYAPPETDNFRVVRFFCFVALAKICVLIASTLCGYAVRLCVQARSLSPHPHLAKAIDTNFLHNLTLCRCVAALSSRGVEPILEWFIARHCVSALFLVVSALWQYSLIKYFSLLLGFACALWYLLYDYRHSSPHIIFFLIFPILPILPNNILTKTCVYFVKCVIFALND